MASVYEVRVTRASRRDLNRIPDKVRHAAVATILGPIAENPRRAGKPLMDELEGLRSARRGDYRIIYEIDEASRTVLVHRIRHRRHVYRPS